MSKTKSKPTVKAKSKPKVKAKKQLTVAQEIAQRERKFKAASPAQKRVMIAADVIAQIKAKRFRPESLTWVDPVRKNGDYFDMGAAAGTAAPVRELFLENKIPACACCALGALFMSCTLYNNKTTVGKFEDEMVDFKDIVRSGRFRNGLTSFFSRDQLRLIEIAFEGGDGAFTPGNDDDYNDAKDWVRSFDVKKRLIAIMENIIDNKGTFNP